MKSIIALAIAMLISVPSFADLWVSPSFLSFGTVKLGNGFYNQKTVTIRNNGKETVNVQVSGYCESFRVSGFCGTLNQYGSCNLQVSFKPTRVGSHHCNIGVRDNTGAYYSISAQGMAQK